MCKKTFRYNWFETNIAAFMGKYPLPAYYDGKDLIEFIRQYKERYLLDFSKILTNGPIKGYSDSVYDMFTKQKEYIEQAFNTVLETLELINNSHYSEAERKIDDLFKNIENDFCVTGINNYHCFNPELYRIRPQIDKPQSEITTNDLFHIPYSKRYLLKNERFSISGQPCLYLATSLNIAWKECGLPSEFYYSQYSFDYSKDEIEKWSFLSFMNPREIMNDFLVTPTLENEKFDVSFICKYLRTFPIIFACSIVSTKKDYPFKPEYVFPQLIMQWVHRNFDRIKGILYFSCVFDEDIRQYAGYNIAIPAVNFNSDGYSIPLLNRFKILKPIHEDNSMPAEISNKYFELFEQLQKFECVQHEMTDCWLNMYQLMHSICIMIKESQNTKSIVQLTLAKQINDNTRSFFEKNKINDIFEKCRNSPVYQERYDENLEKFYKLYLDFSMLVSKLDRYYLKVEHSFPEVEI